MLSVHPALPGKSSIEFGWCCCVANCSPQEIFCHLVGDRVELLQACEVLPVEVVIHMSIHLHKLCPYPAACADSPGFLSQVHIPSLLQYPIIFGIHTPGDAITIQATYG